MVLHVASSFSSVFISCFTLTASECEAVTADDGYKVHSPLSMKREQKQWEMGWMCEGSMWAGTRAHVCV